MPKNKIPTLKMNIADNAKTFLLRIDFIFEYVIFY